MVFEEKTNCLQLVLQADGPLSIRIAQRSIDIKTDAANAAQVKRHTYLPKIPILASTVACVSALGVMVQSTWLFALRMLIKHESVVSQVALVSEMVWVPQRWFP